MTSIVDEPWSGQADVTELTATDLQATRDVNTKVSDTTFELHRLLETLQQNLDDDLTLSETVDRAVRVELAHAIDSFDVSFSRDDYDIAYLIPPVGWLENQEFEEVELLPEGEVDTSDRAIGFSMPSTVDEMADEAIEQDAYETLSDIAKSGTERLLGRK